MEFYSFFINHWQGYEVRRGRNAGRIGISPGSRCNETARREQIAGACRESTKEITPCCLSRPMPPVLSPPRSALRSRSPLGAAAADDEARRQRQDRRRPPPSRRWWEPMATGASSRARPARTRICYTLAQPKERDARRPQTRPRLRLHFRAAGRRRAQRSVASSWASTWRARRRRRRQGRQRQGQEEGQEEGAETRRADRGHRRPRRSTFCPRAPISGSRTPPRRAS